MSENQFRNELEKLEAYADSISENTELYKYIKQINELIYSDGEQKVFESEYKPIVDNLETTEKPFLSVIVRTRGNRAVGLREALLCLRAQTNQNFEVLLIVHKAEKEGKDSVRKIIAEQPEGLRNKIRCIELDRGTRTTPINIGFANAKGRYVAIFDDDDLLFDNWVESFYEAAEKNDGKILHAYALGQKWKVFENDTVEGADEMKYMAVEAPTSQFCTEFNLLSQMVVNKCPLMSLAFPAYLFHDFGIVFNVTLDVTVDWEYFMRVVTITGIVDIKEATSIYRLWTNAENSATLHEQTIWDETYAKIQKSRNARALLVPEGYTEQIVSLIQCAGCTGEQIIKVSNGYPKLYGLLYYGTDNQFTDERMLVGDNQVDIPEIDVTFSVPLDEGDIKEFRYDPCQYGGFIAQELEIVMTTIEGTEIEVLTEEWCHNGMQCESGIYFLKFDPQIAWKYEGDEKIASVRITGNVNMEIPAEVVEDAISFFGKEYNNVRETGKKNRLKRVFGK